MTQTCPKDLVVFTCTWYPNKNDLRCRICFDTLKSMVNHGISVVVVDGSPSPDVRDYLKSSGASMIFEQTSKGKKGAALREAAEKASSLEGVTEDTWLCWQEAEKEDMARHWKSLVNSQCQNVDIVVPMREDSLFKKTYPIEQYHSENYGNLFLDAVARNEYISYKKTLDWHFGPFAFRAKHIQLWTKYNGIMYEAQLVPIVHGIHQGLIVESTIVPFIANEEMKSQEEGQVDFIEKRLNQLADLDPKVKAAWKEDYYHYCD